MRRHNSADITLSEVVSRIRGFIYDSQVSDGEHISLLLGCSDISDEVAEMEEKKSDERIARVDSLIPMMYAYSHAMSEGLVEHQRLHLEEDSKAEGVTGDEWAQTRKVFTQLALNTLLGSFSQLVDMGVITLRSEKKGLFRWYPKTLKK